jgi:polysaccharide pyruvyl transferase WcaK-like protein
MPFKRRSNKLRILHVASFIGNIGDNASHIGLQHILNRFFENYEIEQVEIRKFYRNYQLDDARKFDVSFIAYANTFDLLIIGGGGFLDYWIENSLTGTTIDLHPELVRTITVPTLIMSVGCMPHREVPKGNLEKFKTFLYAVASNQKVAIAVRNDGSINTLKNILPPEELKNIPEILDNGFYFNTELSRFLPIDDYISINITLDQIQMLSNSRGAIDIDFYKKEMVKVINHIALNLNKNIVFVPHIYSDIKAIYEVLECVDDFIVRTKITIAPYLQGDKGANLLFGIYKNSSLVLATRFHANVCAMSMNLPVIGLVALDRVKYLYDDLCASNNYVVLSGLYSDVLNKKINNFFEHSGTAYIHKNNIESKKTSGMVCIESVLKRIGCLGDG